MTPEQFKRVRDLFEQAADVKPADLRAWLDRHAGDDAEVRHMAETLLVLDSRAGAFLTADVASRLPDLLVEESGLQPGDVIGAYVIEGEIGRGGMGHVYVAHDSGLDRKVAIKALAPRLVRDEGQRERLRREARAAAALKHPGICTVYQLEEKDGALFIVTEYVEGHTLREEIASGERPSAKAVRDTALQLAAALASAHEKNITHRDLKPENLMRTVDGRMKILDFGLALDGSADSSQPRVTQPGMLVGTPGYMAPEQVNGEPVDARADIFSFGVLMYEFASGRHPFEARSPVGMAAQILAKEAMPLGERCPALPPALAAAIDRSMQKERGRRFRSGSELVTALESDEPGPSRPAARDKIAAWWRRHQLSAIALYMVAAAWSWQIKEWAQGLAELNFLMVAFAATVAGMFRGFLMFNERINPAGFDFERRRARRTLLAADIIIVIALVANGFIAYRVQRPLVTAITIALAVVILFLHLVAEPSTTEAAFDRRSAPLQ
jgi:predicted Ser/Thr protein kinase